MKTYFDNSFLQNPLFVFLKYFLTKILYQSKYWGKHLRIGYMTSLSNVKFDTFNFTGKHVIIQNSKIGKFTYVSDHSVILESEIGSFCSIGPNVRTAPGKHPTHTFVSTHPSIYSNPPYCLKNFCDYDMHNPKRKVNIGSDVWICANVVIADGVNIGHGAIIGANSLVTKNVEPYSIMSGVPAIHVRYRFSKTQIELLLKDKWWENDIEWIQKNVSKLLAITEYEKQT
jgi:chloramphenicol O-acetyltransferase type B